MKNKTEICALGGYLATLKLKVNKKYISKKEMRNIIASMEDILTDLENK